MRTLTSRTRTRLLNIRPPNPCFRVPVPSVSRVVVSLKVPPPGLCEGPCLRRRLHNLLHVRVSLEARGGCEEAVHRVGRDEDEASVRLRRPRDPAGDLVQVELHDREETLQVGLLVDGEVYVLGSHERKSLREKVVPASLHPLIVETELLHHLGHALGAPPVHGEHPGHVLVTVVPGLDPGPLLRYLGRRGDLLDLDVRPGVLYGLLRAV